MPGQCPVARSYCHLIVVLLHDKIEIAEAVNVKLISLNQAPQGYTDFDKGAPRKVVIGPHRMCA